jgi:rhamnogalacturonyl hydrolase YesR
MKQSFKNLKLFVLTVLILCLNACDNRIESTDLSNDIIQDASFQYKEHVKWARLNNTIPRSIKENEIKPIHHVFDWTAGFFPGSLWYLYELTGDENWASEAKFFQDIPSEMRFFKGSHDLGFVFNNSFGHAYRLFGNEEYLKILIEAGDVLITRFNPTIGAIQSWDIHGGWQSKRGWAFPVIIDNMMNLELLFRLSEWTGDPKYKTIAVVHANTTMNNFFREDNSSYHVVDFDPQTGFVRAKETAQGFSHESSWARGQAWGLYGFTSAYVFTGDSKYLKMAEKIADYYLNHPHLPKDLVPHWDLTLEPSEEVVKDASAAAIVASALIQLDNYSDKDYLTKAKEIMKSLSSDHYFSKRGENHHYLIKHCTGSIPHSEEIDVPLNYADYYFLEAIHRLKNIEQ